LSTRLTCFAEIKKGFSKNRQEDAHEFFRFVTDAFQNTELAGKPK
jgi:ubiquitin C-terminal hydrolase